MPEKKVQLTQEGYDNLNAELRDLLDNVQPQIKEQLSEARALGDLSENADYDAARNQLRETEDRIREIEDTLSNAVIIKGKSNVVALGSIVELEFLNTHKTASYLIVGTVESDMANNKISNESPVGQAIVGKKVGDEVEVKVANPYRVKVVSIQTAK